MTAQMAKRKREEHENPTPKKSVKRQRVQHKLKAGITKIGHAYKVSKGFERQKLGKRRKNAAAKNDDQDVQRIDSEIVALKALDTTTSARQHFFKSLLKIKDVSSHPELPFEVSNPPGLPEDRATLNINARLCKSKQVTDALAVAILDVRSALGLQAEAARLAKKSRPRARDYATNPHKREVASGAGLQQDSLNNARTSEIDNNVSDEHRDSNSGIEEDDFDGTSASNSDDDIADDDGGDIEALERRLASEGIKVKSRNATSNNYNIAADLSLSGSEDGRRSASPEIEKAPPSKQSSFVPSLTLTGYVEGSGSEAEDDVGAAPRKNRRGQRARQQIWEQKYGSKAKHLQESRRNAKWDPKRGAVGGSRGPKHSQTHRGERRSSPDYNLGGNQNGVKRTQKEDSGPIHPSWEAAKKAKQKDTPAAFQGKKITFD